jgi:hypothetical protein
MRNYDFRIPQAWQGVTPPQGVGAEEWQATLAKLHNGQVRMANFIATYPRSLILSTPRTGKTGAALYAADYIRAQDWSRPKVLILCTKSNLLPVWKYHLDLMLPHAKVNVCIGKGAERIAEFENQADYYIMHFDTFRRVCPHVLPQAFGMVIIDEISSAYRHTNTKRHKHAQRAIAGVPYVTGLTGTPTPEGPLDAYGLGKLLGRTAESYTSMNDRMRVKIDPFRWAYKKEATAIATELMRPSMRISAADIFPHAVKLPAQERWVTLTPAQRELAAAMLDQLKAVYNNKTFVAVHEGAKRWRMLQILSGILYEHNLVVKASKSVKKTTTHGLDAESRIAALEDILDEVGNRAIIYSGLTGVISVLKTALRTRAPYVIAGHTSAAERTRIMNRFNAGEGGPLIGEPGCMAHGLDAARGAATIIWYGPIDKGEIYEQANARIEGVNQVYPTQVYHLIGHKFEKKIYDAVSKKLNVQHALLELLREQGT